MWTTSATRGGRGPTVRALCLLLAVLTLLAACSGGDDEADPSPSAAEAEPVTPTDVPDVPVPTEPARATDAPDDGGGEDTTPAASRPPRPGEVVLVHLEGPLDNREATDLVVRDAEGGEIDRFRLPGAVGVWAGPGAGHALIRLLPTGWARYDAADGVLSLVSFPVDVPDAVARPGRGLADSTVLWTPESVRWLLNLDGGPPVDVADQVAEAELVQLATNGSAALLQDAAGPLVLDTAHGEVRRLEGLAHLSDDGQRIGLSVPAEGGREVVVEDVDGGNRQVLGPTTTIGPVVPLPDGRVLLLGTAPAIMDAAGEATPLEPSAPIGVPVRLSADGTRALASGGGGLALVDLGAGSATSLAGTQGWEPLAWGPTGHLWAHGGDEADPGLLVVPPGGEPVRLLDGQDVEAITSVSGDGARVTVAIPVAGGRTSWVVDADGTVTPVLESARSEAAVHPSGTVVAVAGSVGSERTLAIGPLGGAVVEVDTGRNPVWLDTTAPLGRPG